MTGLVTGRFPPGAVYVEATDKKPSTTGNIANPFLEMLPVDHLRQDSDRQQVGNKEFLAFERRVESCLKMAPILIPKFTWLVFISYPAHTITSQQ